MARVARSFAGHASTQSLHPVQSREPPGFGVLLSFEGLGLEGHALEASPCLASIIVVDFGANGRMRAGQRALVALNTDA